MLNRTTDNSDTYIHGTSSIILPLLPRTEFTLLPLQEMLEKYGLVPMCGELEKRSALNSLKASGTFISFGNLNADIKDQYSLYSVLELYTKYHLPDVNIAIQNAKENARDSFLEGFENINKLLVNVARAKQLGEDALSKDEYDGLLKRLNDVTQFYYFLSFLGEHIYLNYTAYTQMERAYKNELLNSPAFDKLMRQAYIDIQNNMKKNHFEDDDISAFTYEKFFEKRINHLISEMLSDHLTFEKLIGKIRELNLDIKAIVDHPTQENLEKLLSVLELSGDFFYESTKLIAPGACLLSLSPDSANKDERDYQADEFEKPLSNKALYTFDKLLMKFFKMPPTSNALAILRTTIKSRIELLEKRMTVLKKIVERDIEETKLFPEEIAVMKQGFPVIILCKASDKISKYSEHEQEYRACKSLKFGEDIMMIATDTPEHQKYLKEFFKKNDVLNMNVLLIDELYKLRSKQTSEASLSCPSSLFSWKKLPEIIAATTPENN